MEYAIIKAKREKNGTITHEMNDGGKLGYVDIRGGIAWPDLASNTPAYYCILGVEHIPAPRYEGVKPPEGSLCLLAEYQADSLLAQTSFLRHLTDDAQRLYCREIYATDVECAGKERSPNVIAYERFCSDNKIRDPYIALKQASFIEKFTLAFIETGARRERGAISIPEATLLHQQLMSAGPEDLNGSIGPKLNAINAYRYALASFVKSPPSTGGVFTPKRAYRPQRKGGLSRYV
jgi:hypothetical protein